MSLPNSWCLSTFEDTFEIISDEGKRLPESEYKPQGRLPVIDQGEEYIGGFTDNEALRYEGPLPVLLFGDHTRRVKLVFQPFVVGAQGIKILSPTRLFEPKFLLYQFPVLDLPNRGYSRHFQFLKKLQFITAPKPEQSRIVAEIEKSLTRLDNAVASLKRVEANLKRYRASVLKAACEGRLVPTEAELARKEGRRYEPASELLKRILAERRAKWESDQTFQRADSDKRARIQTFKKKYVEPQPPDTSNLPQLAEGWSWTSLEQLLREPLRNGHSAKESQDGTGIRTLTLTAITDGNFSEANIKVTSAEPDKVRDLWLEPGDIFVERSNTPELVGTARLFQGQSKFAIFPDLLIRVRVSPLVEPRFLEAVLLSDRVRQYFRKSAQGISGSMPKIDQTTIMRTSIPLPPQTEQLRIAEMLRTTESRIDAAQSTVKNRLRSAERLRRSVLNNAFQGNLVPQDPSDEPASVLLERIRAERANHDSNAKKGRNGAETLFDTLPGEKIEEKPSGASSDGREPQRLKARNKLAQPVRAGKSK